MTKEELISKIKVLAKTAYSERVTAETSAIEYDELTKFPELKQVIIDLLTTDFDKFISGIDWVSPRPTTFRINLKNDSKFYLTYNKRGWVAQIEGKKYYLLNLPEEERAAEAISRMLRYGEPEDKDGEEESFDDGGGLEEPSTEETPTETPTEEPST
jgi:hypothetical protein